MHHGRQMEHGGQSHKIITYIIYYANNLLQLAKKITFSGKLHFSRVQVQTSV